MAGDWIKWTVGLADKREVRIVASRLHRDRHEIAGRLMALWEWTDENIPAESFDPETGDATVEMGETWSAEIDDIAGLPGMAEALASPAICWIQARSGGRVTFPNLGRHNGKTAKTRAMESRKKSRQRGEKCPDSKGTRSGPEKRREEKNNQNPPSPTGIPPKGKPPSAPKVAWSASGGWEGVTEELQARWAEAYPACNIDRQLRAAHEWLFANPTRARKSNWLKFLTNWLSRSQDKGGDERGKRPSNPTGNPLKHGDPNYAESTAITLEDDDLGL
jgi:hypothetical protein